MRGGMALEPDYRTPILRDGRDLRLAPGALPHGDYFGIDHAAFAQFAHTTGKRAGPHYSSNEYTAEKVNP